MARRRFLSRDTVARKLGVAPSTVTRWAKLGMIPAVVTVGGHHRYYATDLDKLAMELSAGRAPAESPTGQGGRFTFEEAPRRRRRAVRPPPSGRRPTADASADMVEIRWHGRGGQGVVTASQVLAEAALLEERYFQAFPEFGPERTGAPIRAFTRLSSLPIDLHCPISTPNIVVVLDPTLLETVNVFEGLRDGGTAILNTSAMPQDVKATVQTDLHWKIVTINATRIAMEAFKRNVPNTPILGALLRAAPVVSVESCLRLLRERLGARLAPQIVEANIVAFQRGYAEATVG